ncbi:DUF4133 domain-containing protein [Parabacteroides merdae]|uniref:DUF4133 domain-containing protein n=1 Tax=Parabacteroides merdae TaxID=46503 RepID=UPI0018A96534|nr:DUF4133 domain-containing protein [Parabacteroides merdae]MDB9082858.1 DUF4133 domain-containing protein [Parabacteroides merdae]
MYARFGGEFSETYRRNTARRWALSLRLKSQYLFIFTGGLLALFVIFVVMYMAGIDQWVCIGFGVVSASVLVWVTFRMNSKYGEWGLMKLHALRSHPRYIISRRKFLRLFSPTIKNRKA